MDIKLTNTSSEPNNLISREQANLLKGIAIITVLLSHGNGFSESFKLIPILKDGFITSIFCQGGMCIFLLLSGYGLYSSYSQNGLKAFWDKRFVKILLPTFFAQALWFFGISFIQFLIYRGLSLEYSSIFSDLIATSAVNSIDGSIWYMSYLFFCYLCFYLFFAFFKSPKVAIITFSIVWIPLMPLSALIWDCSFYCVAAFAIGIWLAYLPGSKAIGKTDKRLRIGLLILFTTIGVYYYTVFRQSKVFDNIASIAVAFAIILLVSFLPNKRFKVLNFFGKHSFSIYLFQGKVIFGWFPYTNYSDTIKLIAFILLFILDIIVAVLFDMLIESVIKRISAN